MEQKDKEQSRLDWWVDPLVKHIAIATWTKGDDRDRHLHEAARLIRLALEDEGKGLKHKNAERLL